MSYTLHVGDCMAILPTLPEGSVQCCVTSPPYFGLRDYGQDGQLGLESTPGEYVAKLVAVFREVRRVLRDDGTVWLNLGDSYAANRGYQVPSTKGGPKHGPGQSAGGTGSVVPEGLKPKDLIGIPWRVAFALQADGWYLRQDVIWHKPNPMPESVTDRCTKAHEYLFLLSKSARYFYDAEAVKEDGSGRMPSSGKGKYGEPIPGHETKAGLTSQTNAFVHRNRRSVWTIATQPYGGAHFATFPPKLIDPCILAGTPEKGCCPHCGAPWERVRERNDIDSADNEVIKHDGVPGLKKGTSGDRVRSLSGSTYKHVFGKTTGHRPTCSCPEHEPVPSTVLDPFGGSGTTAGVAIEHGRKAILCELSEEYAKFVPDRINSITDALTQGRLF